MRSKHGDRSVGQHLRTDLGTRCILKLILEPKSIKTGEQNSIKWASNSGEDGGGAVGRGHRMGETQAGTKMHEL